MQVLETILKRSHVSIIPTREGWVRKYLITIPIRSSFNHPSPRGLGPESRHCTSTMHRFNHPNPRGLGRCSYIYSFKQKIVFQSSQPARAGSSFADLNRDIIEFQSSQPRGLGLHVIMHRNPDNGFNHPSPCGLGHPPHKKMSNIPPFQSSQPARVGSGLIYCNIL